MVTLVAVAFVSPLHAQEAAAAAAGSAGTWSSSGRSSPAASRWRSRRRSARSVRRKGLGAAVEGIARNPSAAGEIRGNLILGLVLIESLVIYVLLISLILFFVVPF